MSQIAGLEITVRRPRPTGHERTGCNPASLMRLLALMCLLSVTVACGMQGDLYLPQDDTSEDKK